MHSIRTTIVTEHEGTITGYGLNIEAQVAGDPAEIAAAFATSLDMIKQTIANQIAQPADPPPGYAPAAPPEESVPPPAGPPRTADEAERRFFARYGQIVGGESWLDVRAYLGIEHAKPTTIEGWITVAQAVRDASHSAAQEPTEHAAPPRRSRPARAAA